MRSWKWVLALASVSGCVVYPDDYGNTGGGSSWTSSTTPPAALEGQVAIGWVVGSAGCEAAGIVTVVIELGGVVEDFACIDESATISAPIGRQPLVVRGLDAGGVARYEGDGGIVRVRGELTTAPTVVLSALPARIETTWSFENGLLCASNGVKDVEVDLFDVDDTLVASDTAACDDALVRLPDVEAGLYVLVALARDAEGRVVYSGESSVDAGSGDTLDLDVVLLPEE